jgi:GNAT superfamily N-acetyltransferase
LNLPPIPDQFETIGRVHAHALATDPERFVVVDEQDASGRGVDRIVAFASALERGPLGFLSMLFVTPGRQAQGLGRALLERVLPTAASGLTMAAVTDSAQPISNGLYATYGIVPRMPLAHLVGRPSRTVALLPLPDGVLVSPLPPASDLPSGVHALDQQVLGFDRPADHRFAIESGRLPFIIESKGRLAGYGYVSPVGHIGPICVDDPALLAPVTTTLLQAVQPRGASAVWVPGAAGETFQALVRAGLRIDGFPLLLCWSRPFADFSRYLPLSPGLL